MGKAVSALIAQDPQLELSEDGAVVIDFSTPEGTQKAIRLQKPLVCGTTGLSRTIFDELASLSKKVPVVYSPNFSIGMALCFEILELIKEEKDLFSHILIEEAHHKNKRDAPSGTAKKMAEILQCEEIISHREDQTAGIHQVDFFLAGEKISLRHEAESREPFARGALTAAKFIYNLEPKFYRLSECLFGNKWAFKA